jgi:hypothetical protein
MTPARDRGQRSDSAGPLERVDEEFAGEHGLTASEASLRDEEHPEVNPQTPGELAHKARLEAEEGEGLVDKAKRVLKEIDRDVSGEYERREDPSAPPAKPDATG